MDPAFVINFHTEVKSIASRWSFWFWFDDLRHFFNKYWTLNRPVNADSINETWETLNITPEDLK